MFQRHLTQRTSRAMKALQIGVCGAIVLLGATTAQSRPHHRGAMGGKAKPVDAKACVAAFNAAQQRAQSGHLREARESFSVCARPSCGDFLRQECTTRYTQLDADIPSVVPIVTDENGAPRVDVQVTMDGEMLTPQLDGRALPVDPGMHEFSFSTDGSVFSGKILIVEGQRNRTISVSLHPTGDKQTHKGSAAPKRAVALEASTPEEQSKTVITPISNTRKKTAAETAETEEAPAKKPDLAAHPEAEEAEGSAAGATPAAETTAEGHPRHGASKMTYVLAAAGLAGIGGYGLLTYWGRKDNDNLGSCSPGCGQGQIDHIRRVYLGADVSLGVGVAALGAAYWVYAVTRAPKEEQASTQEAYRMDVQPSRAGAVATFSGSF
jgi:hypothetical protein